MPFEIRPVSSDDEPRIIEVMEHAFAETMPPEAHDLDRAVYEWDRGLGAVADGELVGHTNLFSLPMTVPGGPLPVAGVSGVGVLPTHRRRGILSALMRRQLTELHEAGRESVASLWASEPGIYPRFGYGLAAEHVSLEVPRPHRRLRPVPGSEGVRLRYADPAESAESCMAVRERVVAKRPGLFSFDKRWRDREVADPQTLREGASALRCVVAEGPDGEVAGYTRYRTRKRPQSSGPGRTVAVESAYAVDAATYAAVWGFLLDQDLMESTTAHRIAVDDPLLSLLVDRRRGNPTVGDALWLRVVDVDRALAGRTYAAPIDVVFEVADDTCPWNARRWHLAGDSGGASCEPTAAEPDLALDVRDLGALYLGRPALPALDAAGLVREGTAGSVAAVAAAFRHDPLPWCDVVF